MTMLEKVKPHGEARFRDKQFGIMTRNDSARPRKGVMTHLAAAPDKRCMLQLDISNAFGSVGRSFIQEALQELSVALRCCRLRTIIDHWLLHTYHAIVPGQKSYRTAVPTQL